VQTRMQERILVVAMTEVTEQRALAPLARIIVASRQTVVDQDRDTLLSDSSTALSQPGSSRFTSDV
jgi:hypothetical protein